MIFIENFFPCQRPYKWTQVLPVGPANTNTFAWLFVREPTFITHFQGKCRYFTVNPVQRQRFFLHPGARRTSQQCFLCIIQTGGGVQYAELQKIWKLRYAKWEGEMFLSHPPSLPRSPPLSPSLPLPPLCLVAAARSESILCCADSWLICHRDELAEKKMHANAQRERE